MTSLFCVQTTSVATTKLCAYSSIGLVGAFQSMKLHSSRHFIPHSYYKNIKPSLPGYQRRPFSEAAEEVALSLKDGCNGLLSQETDIPLVFVPGMKGTHLSFMDDRSNLTPLSELIKSSSVTSQMLKTFQFSSASLFSPFIDNKQSTGAGVKRRAWLTLPGLLNFPPRPDQHPDRSLALPLSYTNGVQDRGKLFADGIVDHVIELGNADFLPFYGHATKHLREVNNRYQRKKIGSVELTNEKQRDQEDQSHLHRGCRPTSVFPYDWRRSLPELSSELHDFCEATYPDQPVQLVAHSLGGLLSFTAMRRHPDKYAPGAVLVGVPFGTGIQYLEDLHRGYYTELDRCRQFTPTDQFTFSSHWSFFPVSPTELGDTFVDVSSSFGKIKGQGEDENKALSEKGKPAGPSVRFVPDVSSIGKVTADSSFQPNAVEGDKVNIDFYNVEEWERNEIGIFDPKYRRKYSQEDLQCYKEHMRIQLKWAKEWRANALSPMRRDKENMPPLVVCATNSIPTINQILRRKRDMFSKNEDATSIFPNFIGNTTYKEENVCSWEYDYSSGRSVPGDGRIDFDKAFPKGDIPIKKIKLNSLHTKQMVWEENGGNWGKIWNEVELQIQSYESDRISVQDRKRQDIPFIKT